MPLNPISRSSHQTILSASSRYDSGPVKGACVMALSEGRGIYLPLTGSEHTLSWRLRALMGHEIIVNNFLNWC
jgi:hypothetical protein